MRNTSRCACNYTTPSEEVFRKLGNNIKPPTPKHAITVLTPMNMGTRTNGHGALLVTGVDRVSVDIDGNETFILNIDSGACTRPFCGSYEYARQDEGVFGVPWFAFYPF
ncbi:hypothetical protein [Ereboglobus luteus]|uniref:Uncharacterized protein n=1 Tax=Ereboglobus luteus TaxID=1796921 RepID=A0A2U8E371_9BACT|nr:hypothetical protein [Ereboglobus luteus]AWI09317.1 hypothetical protein CKA38_08745 [Ereboglobus luteus]